MSDPKRYDARQHHIRPDVINEYALVVIKKLQGAGFNAYVVGGGVRDLLVGLKPKDFDVATDATPEQVKQTIKNCRLIGKRFRLAHVYFQRHIVEVATFRCGHEYATSTQHAANRDGVITRDNVYGTIEQDAFRRDVTVNALFYDPAREEILDFVGAMKDIEQRCIRVIGNPNVRYQEDPIRMLRVLRIANKLNFTIEEKTRVAIFNMSNQLKNMPSARLFKEYIKLFLHGHAVKNYQSLRQYGCLEHLFPHAVQYATDENYNVLVQRALQNTDERINVNKTINPGFLIAVFLWHPLLQLTEQIIQQDNLPFNEALHAASVDLLRQQVQYVAMPHYFSLFVRAIWRLQMQMERCRPRAVAHILSHSRFRAAYDFFVLRQATGEVSQTLVDWWTAIQTRDGQMRQTMIQQLDAMGDGG